MCKFIKYYFKNSKWSFVLKKSAYKRLYYCVGLLQQEYTRTTPNNILTLAYMLIWFMAMHNVTKDVFLL